MGPAGDLGPDQGILGMEIGGVDLFQAVPADIIIPVTGGPFQIGFPDMGFLHGPDDPQLIIFRGLVDPVETVFESRQDGRREIKYFTGDSEIPVKLCK